VDGLVESLRGLHPAAVLAVAVLLVMGETAVILGLLFPVEATLLFVGFLAYLGEIPLAPVVALLVGAAVAGDALALRSGRKYGPRVRASRFGRWVGPDRWAKADRVLHRFGGRSAFLARWIPFVRTLLPRLAGGAGIRYRAFAPWNLPGAATAVGSQVVLGYLAGASYQRAATWAGRLTLGVLAVAMVVAVLAHTAVWLRRRAARNAR
jgi:membrane protein DedA with SNARE-associated domain